jgi:sugar phosphate isomerase/epimerase
MSKWPIGVFTSIDDGLGVHLDVVKELQIPTVHLHCPLPENRTEDHARAYLDKAADAGFEATVLFSGFAGETYESIQRTAETVGIVPEGLRDARAAEYRTVSDFAKFIGCGVVGMHVGFVPGRDTDSYKNLVEVTQSLLDYVKDNGQNMHLETGQESAEHLLEFIGDVNRDNLFINFDPANLILYGTDHPIDALIKVGHLVRSVHCKDGTYAPVAGRGTDWGAEVPLGEGDVGMLTYLKVLDSIGYTGPLTIEREIAEDRERQKADIGAAVSLLESLRDQVG